MKKHNAVPSSEEISCPNCGRRNPSWYASCEKCGGRLSLSAAGQPLALPKRRKAEKRPGCLTVYASLMGLGAALTLLGGIGIGFLSMSNRTMSIPVGFGFIFGALLLAGLSYTIANGLMQQRNWARLAVIVLQSLGVASAVFSICLATGAYGMQDPLFEIACRNLFGGAISAYLVYWFATHKRYFR